MTEITFYILQSSTVDAFVLFGCKLIEKAHRQGKHILVHTGDTALGEALNSRLWDFRPDAYVPHDFDQLTKSTQINATEDESPNDNCSPVAITAARDLPMYNDVLINLSQERPDYFARFRRFIQIANQDEEQLNSARKSYAYFRDRGYPIENIKVNY